MKPGRTYLAASPIIIQPSWYLAFEYLYVDRIAAALVASNRRSALAILSSSRLDAIFAKWVSRARMEGEDEIREARRYIE
jgi:hypothetical protein